MMTPAERLYSYLQLKLHGYTHEEAEAIIGDINEQMEEANKDEQ